MPGATLECFVSESAQGAVRTETWTAVRGPYEVFPGLVKSFLGGAGKPLTRELLRVEGP